MDKIKKAFNAKKANIGYIVAGYPNLDYTAEFINSLDNGVLDLLEIGIPYSDPLADGKLISNAAFEAVQNGVNTDSVFEMLSKTKTNKCLVFLVYYNLILAYGEDKFLQKTKEVGVSGLIVPDLPLEESDEFARKCANLNLAFVPLISVTSGNRMQEIAKHASGFIYVVGALGVTGGGQSPLDRIKDLVVQIRKYSNLPLAVGFGIKTNEDVKKTKLYADGAIVGTKIVEYSGSSTIDELNEKIKDLFKD